MTTPRVLVCDAEGHVHHALRRALTDVADVLSCTNVEDGLDALRRHGPFAVLIGEVRVGDDDGLRLLEEARELAPGTVRIVLTGHGDHESAQRAVNRAAVFRYLTKPIRPADIVTEVQAALVHHGRGLGEDDLLDRTLRRSIDALIEVLGLVNPPALERSEKIEYYVSRMASQIVVGDRREYKRAAALSQLGCVTIPPETLKRIFAGQPVSQEERSMFAAAPEVASTIIGSIPQLERVAQMIAWQRFGRADFEKIPEADVSGPVVVGAQMLKIAQDYDRLLSIGKRHQEAVNMLRSRRGVYIESLLDALAVLDSNADESTVILSIRVEDLAIGMTFDEDVTAPNNVVLVDKGQAVTMALIKRLRNFAGGIGVNEPFRVRVSHAPSIQATEFAMHKE